MSRTSHRSIRTLLLFSFLIPLIAVLACSEADAPDTGGTSEPSNAQTPDPTTLVANRPTGKPEPANAPRSPHERPMPGFEGRTLDGSTLRVGDLLGSRLVIFLVNPDVDAAIPAADAVSRIAKLRGDHNFRVLGVGVGTNSPTLKAFAEAHDLDFPIIDDSNGAISQKLRLRSPVGILGVDAEGYMSFGMANFPTEGDITGGIEAQLREQLRLPALPDAGAGELISYPKAPALGLSAMSSGEVVETSDLEGRAAVVIFFLHTCPHCHKALAALKTILAGIDEANRPRLVAVSLQNNPSGIRKAMKELELDYFDPYLDPGQKATERWGVIGGVPEIFVLDPQGGIRHNSSGWEEKRHAGMLRMHVARAAGIKVPMLLDPTGYSGNEVCGVCHEQELATWQYTKHASAYDTLVTHGADRRTDCVGCHVVGFEEKGGYDFVRRQPGLEDVGCESCHGRGGPHLSPAFVPEGRYAEVCSTCHNPTHSLGFDYDTFRPRISHKTIAAMTSTERAELLGSAGPKRDSMLTRAEYVGSDACESCHKPEFKTWQASPHGHAVATLEAKGQATNTECLACHTTAFDKPGGFASNAVASDEPDLARVGCESCHGPGSEHVGETAKRVGTILSLGDKCDSCVILRVCGTCHDDANDPGFQFEVEARIEAQRHGTIESAATRAGDSAALDLDESARDQHDRWILQGAFHQLAQSEVAPAPIRLGGSAPESGSARPGPS
jgi:peroxiredoxin